MGFNSGFKGLTGGVCACTRITHTHNSRSWNVPSQS